MAAMPIISNFQYDFLLQLVLTDTEATFDDVAKAAAHHSVGRRVADRPGKVIRVRRQGDESFFPRAEKLSAAGVRPMETLEFIFCDA